MRVFSLLFVSLISASAVLSEDDWTCEECSEGGPALGDWLASEDNLMHETDVLLAEVCPRHPEPQYCQDNLPRFWKEAGPARHVLTGPRTSWPLRRQLWPGPPH